jgi:threonine/homoserine/homoserine lactone efflux protein
MLDFQTFPLFLTTTLLVVLTPGRGIFYVAARTLAGGRSEGLASSFGSGVGGFVHFIAAAVGFSALVMASAEAFTVLKIAGAATCSGSASRHGGKQAS